MNKLIVSFWCCVMVCSPALAKKPDWAGNENTEKVTGVVKSEQRTEPDKGRSESRYSSEERRVIRNYFLGADTQASGADKQKGKNKHKSLPPGLQKKISRGGELPPGWQKKVAAGEVLDAELYSQTEALPDDLNRVLDQVAGEQHRRIGNKVIKVLEGDATVIDVIDIMDGL
ncbi:hypothetical protein [Amphritea balenae]|uniref:RcnB family protein n=1 Tax=Amphritea balenae TaxID=452629 RepID=A0A3P1SVB2_9GAMM|nr:hypothetical protein [Amphritea balenae]RRD01154.1 hypothetical protein EHS89_00910 [Amphritea balenae]GGK59476.1 hypothetical protein GCM10007941_07150 [Amphritea balenae]